jgi:hypothetical protein
MVVEPGLLRSAAVANVRQDPSVSGTVISGNCIQIRAALARLRVWVRRAEGPWGRFDLPCFPCSERHWCLAHRMRKLAAKGAMAETG